MAAFMVVTVSIPLGLERPHWRSASAAVFIAWFATAVVGLGLGTGRWASSVFTALIFAGAMLFFASNGVLMVSLREEKNRSETLLKEVTESRAALDRAHRQLQETAAQQQHLAVLEERQRLAREIHDSVAHSLTALVVQTQAARKLIFRDAEKASESVAYCEQMVRDALLEIRRAVRALHPAGLEQVTLVEALQRLARDFGAATGMQVEVQADEGVRSLPPHKRRLEHLYRIFQEALTNAHRHGRATAAAATLTSTPDQLMLTIRNNGRPPESMEPGVGLKSMSERISSLGGRIAFVPGPVGLTIHISLPIEEEGAG